MVPAAGFTLMASVVFLCVCVEQGGACCCLAGDPLHSYLFLFVAAGYCWHIQLLQPMFFVSYSLISLVVGRCFWFQSLVWAFCFWPRVKAGLVDSGLIYKFCVLALCLLSISQVCPEILSFDQFIHYLRDIKKKIDEMVEILELGSGWPCILKII